MKRILLCFIGIFFALSLSAEEYTIDDLTEFVVANSHELQKAQYAYDAAVRDRVPLYDYKGIKLGYSGGYNDYIGDSPPTGNPTFANTFNLILPIIDQITLNSSLQLSTDLGQSDTVTGGSIGISINPFSFNTQRTASRHTVTNTQNSLNALQASLYFDIRAAVLRYLNAKENLYLMLGPDWKEGEILPYSLETLLTEIETLQQRIDGIDVSAIRSASLDQLELQLSLYEEQRSKTLAYDPELSLGFNLGFDDFSASIPQVSATLVLTLSPGNFKTADREDLRQQIRETSAAIAQERYSLANAINIAREKLTESYSFYELAKSSYDNAVIIFEETKILVEYGDRIPLELEQSEWDMKNAAQSLYQASLDLFDYQGDFLKMIY